MSDPSPLRVARGVVQILFVVLGALTFIVSVAGLLSGADIRSVSYAAACSSMFLWWGGVPSPLGSVY